MNIVDGEIKQFFRGPVGIALAAFVILLLSGTTFVVGEASTGRSICVLSINCTADTNGGIGGDTSVKGDNPVVETSPSLPEPSLPQESTQDYSFQIAAGVAAIAAALWWIIFFL